MVTAPEYGRYINLVIRFRDDGYRAGRLYSISPLRVADIGFNATLQRANRDLRFLLAATGDVAGAAEVATVEQKDRGRHHAMLARGGRVLLWRRYANLGEATCQAGLAGCKRWQCALGIYDQLMLQISAQTWNVWVPGSSVLGGSDVIAAEMEEVIDLIVG
jgi:hypothetical protein